jgi:riboflavin biosynthesis pyrimidine reductase
MEPLELLYEADGLPRFELPDELAELYPGALGFDRPRLVANFVATVDGVVAVPSLARSNQLVAAGSESDRFVLGLLRACADVLVIGSGTLLASPRGVWSPEQAHPPSAGAFAELRGRLGLDPRLDVAILSASGAIDPGHPAFAAGAVLLTTDGGAALLEGRLPAGSLVSLGPGPLLDAAAAVEHLRGRGHRLVLSEGGPTAIGSLLSAGLVDELFLTVSPLLLGRDALDPRLALVEGADLLPGGPPHAELLSVRRDGSHLFLRYGLRESAKAESATAISATR